MRKNRKLKTTLFLMPTIILVASFIVLSLAFDFAVWFQSRNIVSKKMGKVLQDFDKFYHEPDEFIPDKEQETNDEFFVLMHYMILDENKNIVFPNEYWGTNKEREEAQQIVTHFIQEKTRLDDGEILEKKIEGKMYMLQSKSYQGNFQGIFIAPDDSEAAKKYIVVVYSNITSIKKIMNLLGKIWVGLIIVSASLAILMMFGMAKRIDNSLTKLKNYLWLIGKRQTVPEPVELDYREFNEVMDVMLDMAKMIDCSQEMQKQFFQNASHELRTPLMSIQGYAEGMYSGVVEQENALTVIIKESKKMTELINEMLFLSKSIDNELEKKELNLSDVLHQCRMEMEGVAKEKGIHVKLSVQNNIILKGDEERLSHAVSNLLSNALCYARHRIDIGCEIQGQEVIIWVMDDGKGFFPEDLPHIFKRFYKGRDGNFGIGLALTKEMVEQHGGNIQVESCDGNTLFTIVLPFVNN